MTRRIERASPPLRLGLGAFISSVDRFAVAPMIVAIADGLGASVSATLAAASLYYLAYGLSQPVWGILSDRHGRVGLMRVTLVVGGFASIASAFAPGLGALVALRAVAGACFGAVVPTSLTYVGDTFPPTHRQQALSDVMAAIAVGTALATAGAGLVAGWTPPGWRFAFAASGVVGVLVGLALRGLPEPPREGERPGLGAQLAGALLHPWAALVYALVFVEGAILLGLLTLLPPALAHEGVGLGVAGLSTAAYGVGVLLLSRLVRVAAARLRPAALMAIGGASMTAAFALVASSLTVPGVMAGAVLLGSSWAFLHSSLQTWATSVYPAARGTVVAFFAGSLFLGSAAGAALAAPWAGQSRYGAVFALAAAASVPLTLAAVAGRVAYDRRH